MVNKGILFEPHRWSTNLFANARFTVVVIGTLIISVTSFARGPLLQQATKTRSSEFITEGLSMIVDILPRIPDGLAGMVLSSARSSASYDLTAAAVQWYQNRTIINNGPDSSYNCDGTCHGIIQAPGISVECSKSTKELNLRSAVNDNIFLLAFNMARDTDNHPLMNFTSIHSSSVDSDCKSTITTNTCYIYAAIAKYPVTIRGSSISLSLFSTSEFNSTERLYYPGDLPGARNNAPSGPLYGLLYLTNTYFASSSTLSYSSGKFNMPSDGIPAETLYNYPTNGSQVCNYTWRDPTAEVLNAMSSTLFRLAMNSNSIAGTQISGNATRIPQSFPITKLSTELVFKSDYRWLIAALVVETLALVVAFGLVWGFWGLKREVSLSPVETLQAFIGLRIGEGRGVRDLSADDMVKSFGREEVMYIADRRG